MQNISLNISEPNTFNFKKDNYSKLALKTFNVGLLEPYRSHLSHFSLNTIEECINKCREYDNLKQEWDYCEFIRRSQFDSSRKLTSTFMQPSFKQIPSPKASPSPPPLPPRPFPRQISEPFRSNPHHPFYQQTPIRSSFPSQPLQSFRNPHAPPPKFFTNRQVFGPKSGTSQVKPHKPEPMDISARVKTQPIENFGNRKISHTHHN